MISSLLLRSLPIFGLLNGLVCAGASYQLDTEYSGASFFDEWDFFTAPDPTSGYVNYIDASTASTNKLTRIGDDGTVYIGVDTTTVLDPNGKGRDSVRITTKRQFTHGLIIGDITNMPGGVCGTWPAFWSFGPNWPTSGEIDMIEGVNTQSQNLMSLHVSGECTIAGDQQSGALQTANCDQSAGSGSGCGNLDSTSKSYGTGFNSNGGGVFATEWTSDYIKIWFFPAGGIPGDITSGTPDPSSWGTPASNFEGDCNIDDHFKDHNIIFDTTFCGQWAGSVWANDPVCSGLAPTCQEYVAANPGAFNEMYWAIKSVKVYQLQDLPATSSTPTPSSTTEVPTSSTIPSTVITSTFEISTSSTEVPTTSEQPTSPIDSSSQIVPTSSETVSPIESTTFSTLSASSATGTDITTSTDIDTSTTESGSSTQTTSESITSSSVSFPSPSSSNSPTSFSIPSNSSSTHFPSPTLHSHHWPNATYSYGSNITRIRPTGISGGVYAETSLRPANNSGTLTPSGVNVIPTASVGIEGYKNATGTTSSKCARSSASDPFIAAVNRDIAPAPARSEVRSEDLPIQYSVSTVYATSVYTIVDCPTYVTDCPSRLGKTTTEIISLSTILCPVSTAPAAIPTSNSNGQTTYTPSFSFSTVYATKVYTISACPETVSNCPERLGQLTTEITSLYTTTCPVSIHSTTTHIFLTSAIPQSSVLGFGMGGPATVSYSVITSPKNYGTAAEATTSAILTVTSNSLPSVLTSDVKAPLQTSLVTVVPIVTPAYPHENSTTSGVQGSITVGSPPKYTEITAGYGRNTVRMSAMLAFTGFVAVFLFL